MVAEKTSKELKKDENEIKKTRGKRNQKIVLFDSSSTESDLSDIETMVTKRTFDVDSSVSSSEDPDTFNSTLKTKNTKKNIWQIDSSESEEEAEFSRKHESTESSLNHHHKPENHNKDKNASLTRHSRNTRLNKNSRSTHKDNESLNNEKKALKKQKLMNSSVKESYIDEQQLLKRSIMKPPAFKLPATLTKSMKSKQKSTMVENRISTDDHLLWIDKYIPTNEAELAVHKKKVSDVSSWLQAALNMKKPSILTLTGPSGSGKSTVIRTLATSLDYEILEWINPIIPRIEEDDYQYDMVTSSISSRFKEFLQRAASSGTILSTNTSNDSRSKCKYKVILIEDLPNVCHPTIRESVHQAIRNYAYSTRSHHPLIFILTDTPMNQTDQGRKFLQEEVINLRLLIPPDIRMNQISSRINHNHPYKNPTMFAFTEIKFNPIAPTFVTKALSRITDQEWKYRLDTKRKSTLLKQVSQCSEGDLRWAINTLQFMHLNLNSLNFLDESEIQAQLGRDHSTLLFSALGKVLYNKREDEMDLESKYSLPSHMKNYERKFRPSFIPEEMVNKVPLAKSSFNLYLHHNYLDFFDDIDQVVIASEYSSLADVLDGLWQHQTILSDYSSSIMFRGLLYSNDKSTETHSKPNFRKQFYKPQIWKQQSDARELEQKLNFKVWEIWYNRWAQYNSSYSMQFLKAPSPLLVENDSWFYLSPSVSNQRLLLDTLPFIANMMKSAYSTRYPVQGASYGTFASTQEQRADHSIKNISFKWIEDIKWVYQLTHLKFVKGSWSAYSANRLSLSQDLDEDNDEENDQEISNSSFHANESKKCPLLYEELGDQEFVSVENVLDFQKKLLLEDDIEDFSD